MVMYCWSCLQVQLAPCWQVFTPTSHPEPCLQVQLSLRWQDFIPAVGPEPTLPIQLSLIRILYLMAILSPVSKSNSGFYPAGHPAPSLHPGRLSHLLAILNPVSKSSSLHAGRLSNLLAILNPTGLWITTWPCLHHFIYQSTTYMLKLLLLLHPGMVQLNALSLMVLYIYGYFTVLCIFSSVICYGFIYKKYLSI